MLVDQVDTNRTSPIKGQCFICSDLAKLVCQKCEKVSFCSEDHGRLHYREGFAECFPYRVGFTDGVGRQLITTRDVIQGEVIYVEDPIVVGPTQECAPICLCCLRAIDTSYLCRGCGYPFCDEECAGDPSHRLECQVLSNAPPPVFRIGGDGQNNAYHPILPLRLLLQQSQNKTGAKLAEQLMDHKEERKGSDYWVFSEEHVVQFLHESCKQTQWTNEEIRNAIGILEVNGYEIKNLQTCGYRGLFPLTSLVSHKCIPNCKMVLNTEAPYTNKMVAGQDLKAGEEIAISYLRPSMCSLIRRKAIKNGWYFDCTCSRCCDPTELGSHTNTLLCPGCRADHLLPLHPLDYDSVWLCKCGHQETSQAVTELVEGFLEEVETLQENDRYNTDKWVDMHTRAKENFHPGHEVMTEVAKWSVPILGRGIGKTFSDFPITLIESKVEMATNYLAVLAIVEGGMSKMRAKTMYELVDSHIYLASVGKCMRGAVKHSTKDMLAKMEEVEVILSVLGVKGSYEGIVLHGANTFKKMFQDLLGVQNVRNAT